MPLGIVSEHEYEKEQAAINKVPIASVIDITRGRGDRTNAPESLRKIIGEEGVKGVSNGALAKTFDVSPQSVSAYKNGATSCATYNKPDEKLDEHIAVERESISRTARQKMIEAFESMTPEKIANAKLKDASQVVKDMSAVIRNIEPHRDGNEMNVSFQFYAPPTKSLNEYDIIDVRDK